MGYISFFETVGIESQLKHGQESNRDRLLSTEIDFLCGLWLQNVNLAKNWDIIKDEEIRKEVYGLMDDLHNLYRDSQDFGDLFVENYFYEGDLAYNWQYIKFAKEKYNEQILSFKLREEYEDLAVVCYINSSAALKTYADVCVTSSNAVEIVRKLPNKNIFFIPDENLGSYVAKQVPEKNVILNDGYCYVHKEVNKEQVEEIKRCHPGVEFLVHPECTKEVLELADYVGSTSGIIDHATKSDKKEFIIGTENGVLYELQQKNPDQKILYTARRTDLYIHEKDKPWKKVRDCLKYNKGEVSVDDSLRRKANVPLNRMLETAK